MSVSISATVGRFGVNKENDVAEIQQLLNRVAIAQGGPVLPIPVNGFCGEQTKAAIKSFQSFHLGPDEADGRIAPRSKTCTLLENLGAAEKPVSKMESQFTDFNIRASAQDRYYEVRTASGTGTAVYWIGVPPVPRQPLLWFEDNEVLFRAPGHLKLEHLECRASFTTRASHGNLTSELALHLPSGVVRILMSAHLPTVSHTGMAAVGGLFKRVA